MNPAALARAKRAIPSGHVRARAANTVKARLLRSGRVRGGASVLAGIALVAVLGPQLFGLDPVQQHLRIAARPPGELEHLLGTDPLGRDMLARLLVGARVSLLVGAAAVLLSGLLGVPAGLGAGYFGGRVDAVLMRLVDVQLAIPVVLLVIALVGIAGPSLPNLIVVLGVSGWMLYARTIRAVVLSLRAQLFVEAARAAGCSDLRILVSHLLPNVWTPAIVIATQQVGTMILLESTLSFLGIGVQPPVPSWGGMIADGRSYLVSGWWIATLPGLALLVTVLAVNFIGDGLRDALDLRLQI